MRKTATPRVGGNITLAHLKKMRRQPATMIVTITLSSIMNLSIIPKNHAPTVHCRNTLYGGGAGFAKKTMAMVSMAPLNSGMGWGANRQVDATQEDAAKMSPPAARNASTMLRELHFTKAVTNLLASGRPAGGLSSTGRSGCAEGGALCMVARRIAQALTERGDLEMKEKAPESSRLRKGREAHSSTFLIIVEERLGQCRSCKRNRFHT